MPQIQHHDPVRHASVSQASIKDVALEAGVHFSTVSKALRNHPRIALSTRERVRAAAARLGYTPNQVYQALTARRSNATAVLAPPRMVFVSNRPNEAAFADTAHMRLFFSGARHQAECLGYQCDLLLVGDEALTASDVARRLESPHTDGLIIGAFVPHLRLVEFDWDRYPLVKIDSAFMLPRAAMVSNDQMQMLRSAYDHGRRLGYRRIGMAIGRIDDQNTHGLYSSGLFLSEDLHNAEPIAPLYFGHSEDTRAIGRRLAKWIRAHRIDLVLCNWTNIRDLLGAGGLRSPADIACACLALSDPDPSLAGILANHHAIGCKVAEALALVLQGQAIPMASVTYVPGAWQDGASAPAIHAAAR